MDAKPREFPSLPKLTGPARPNSRVCIASFDFVGPVRNGGVGTAFTSLGEALAAAGHEVTFLYLSGTWCENLKLSHWIDGYASKNIRFVPMPEPPQLRVEAPWHAIRSYHAYLWLREQNFDVVHFSEWRAPGYYSILAKHQGLAFQKTLLCVHTHGPTLWSRLSNGEYLSTVEDIELDEMERFSVKQTDVVVSPSRYLLRWMQDQGWSLPQATFVQQYVQPATATASSQKPSSEPIPVRELVFFGRLEVRKGLVLFCDALDRLKDDPHMRSLRITFLGKVTPIHGREGREYLEHRSRQWPWRWKIISDKDQPGALAHLRQPGCLAILPSLVDNLPNTVLECLGAHVPFVTSDIGGIPEMIAPEDFQRTCSPLRAPALAQRIRTAVVEGTRPVTPAVDAEATRQAWLDWHARSNEAERAPLTVQLASATPLVSICMSHFNRPNYLKQALASIEAQDYPNIEVVLVDDASTDKETLRFLEALEPQFAARGWQLIRNQEEAFVGAARNLAARRARGEYIKFMDDDNCAKPNEISTFVKVARHTGADILTCFLDFFSGHNPPRTEEPPNFRLLFLGAAPGPGVFRNCFGDTNSLIKRDVFIALGGFHEHRGIGHEDWELFGDALLKGYRLEVVPEALVWYRRNDSGENITVRNSVHGGHMRNIRPFLDAVPPSLRNVLLFAQGHEIANRGNGGFGGAAHGDLHQVIRWRSLLEAGRILRNLNQREEAIRLLVEAVSKAEITQHPVLILEAVLEVGTEMRRLDTRRARELLELGLQLATTIRNTAAQKVAKSLLAEIPEAVEATVAESPASFATRQITPGPANRLTTAVASPSSPFANPAPARVSIVIPVFNKVEFTRQCLEALDRDATSVPREIILVDNGSTDGTAVFLREAEACGRVRCVRNEQNLGFARACNQGAKAATSDYVLFLNNDTQVRPGWMEPLLTVLEQDGNAAAVGSKLLFPDGTLQHAGVVLAEYPGRDPLLATHIYYRGAANLAEASQRRIYPALTAACLLVRKRSFEAAGGFDEDFWNGYEDVDLCLRLQERGWHCVYEPASVVVHHESQSGSERFQKVQENIRRLHSKWLGKVKLDARCRADGTLEMLPTSKVRPYGHEGDTQSFTSFTSIVILAHNQLADTRLCLESIAAHTPQPHELIVVDNGSTDGTPEYLQSLSEHRRELQCIFNKTNLGFAAGVNQGLARARGDQVVLLNNDTVLTPGWLSGLLDVLARHPKTGLVGPVTNYVSGPQLVKDVPYRQLDQLPAFAQAWANQHAGRTRPVDRLVGFCLLVRRSVIEAIGGFDEDYGSGNFEDDDYCLRAGLAGFQAEVAQQVFIHHTGSQTFKGAKLDYRTSMLSNWQRFKGKWGLPADAPIEQGYRLPLQLSNPQDLKFPLSDAQISRATGKPMAIPAVARVGDLKEASSLLARGDLSGAWQETLRMLQCRPFHPEAWLLLAEVAWAAGRQDLVKQCVAEAERMTPKWKPVRKFLKKHPARSAKQTVQLTSLPSSGSPRLTVCLIVRNEEDMLPRCLKSVQTVADQLVVVDTGSTDKTLEVAMEFGAEIYQTEWTDDFSAPRNLALEKATGDWVLMLDADEQLSESGRTRLKTELGRDGVLGYRLPIVEAGHEEEGANYVPRLFRNAPGLFYVGRIHEQVFSSLQVRQLEWSLENLLGKTTLIHHGYSRERIAGRDKIARNLHLLELALIDDPKDPNILMNLGLELTRSGRKEEGLKRYWEAVQVMSALPQEHIVPELRETLLTQLAAHLSGQSDFAAVVRLLRSPLARNGGLNASLHFALGLSLINLRRWAEASDEFRHCITKRDQPALCPINTEIRKAAPRHCLAMCQAQMKQTDAARASFEQALQEDPSSRAVHLDYARFLADTGDSIGALKGVHQLIAEDGNDAEVWITGARLALAKPDFLEFALDWTGEAIKHVSANQTVLALRAETLLLAGRIEEALPLWEQINNQIAATAARALCLTALGRSVDVAREQEQAVSQEFLRWYRRLIDFNAELTILAVNNHLNLLQAVLPTVNGVLEAALVEAN